MLPCMHLKFGTDHETVIVISVTSKKQQLVSDIVMRALDFFFERLKLKSNRLIKPVLIVQSDWAIMGT